MDNTEKFALVPYDTYLTLIKQTSPSFPHTIEGAVIAKRVKDISGGAMKQTSKPPPPGLPSIEEEIDTLTEIDS